MKRIASAAAALLVIGAVVAPGARAEICLDFGPDGKGSSPGITLQQAVRSRLDRR